MMKEKASSNPFGDLDLTKDTADYKLMKDANNMEKGCTCSKMDKAFEGLEKPDMAVDSEKDENGDDLVKCVE